MSLKLENCSPSKTITVRHFSKIEQEESRMNRLRQIASQNLQNCRRLLLHNAAHDIHVFRFSSKLIPLATHPLVRGWDYVSDLKEDFTIVGELVRKHNMRVSTHPDHYTLINSPKQEVLEASLRDLEYHVNIFRAMGLPNAEMIMHIGGFYGSKDKSLQRFIDNFELLPENTRQRLRLENDDKCYGAKDVLFVCRKLGVPMIFDLHHHWCKNYGEHVGDVLPKVFKTWKGKLPKIHVSSPKSEKNFRAHADEIEADPFYEFLLTARELNEDFDVMVEAKNKDLALFNLLKKLKTRKNIKMVDDGTIEVG